LGRTLLSFALLGLLSSCGGKSADAAKETAEIRATCEKLVALEMRYTESKDAGPAADPPYEGEVGSILGDFRGLVEVLGSSPPASVADLTRCSADLHLYRGASEKGFACLRTCADEAGYARAKRCVEKCVMADEALETARRASRKQREVTARDWLFTVAGKPMTTTVAKLTAPTGSERVLTIDLPDQPALAGPGSWTIERTGALQPPTVKVEILDAAGTPAFREIATSATTTSPLTDYKEREDDDRYMLARVGPDPKMSRDPSNATHRDRLLVTVIRKEGEDWLRCSMEIGLLDMDDGLANAGVLWTENLCNWISPK
jgi:hypothetical protein